MATKRREGTAEDIGAARAAIERAERALRERSPHDALRSLLEAWRHHRAAEIAVVIEALGQSFDAVRPAIDPELRRRELDESWRAIAGERQPADIGRLVAVLPLGSAPMLKEWLIELTDFPLDPRVARPALAAANNFTSTGAGPTRTAAMRLAIQIGDGRLVTKPLKGVDTTKISPPPELVPELSASLATISSLVTKLTPRDLGEATILSRVKTSSADGASLLAAVLASPRDPTLRVVYGDWLTEHGDPRGELIALQSREEENSGGAKRIAEIIRIHGRRFIEPLDRALKEPRFSLGFLHGCESIKFRSKADRDILARHALWATLEEIDLCEDVEFLTAGALPALRSLRSSVECFAKLAESKTPPPALEEIRLDINVSNVSDLIRGYTPLLEDEESVWPALADIGSLVNVRKIVLKAVPDFGQDKDGQLADRYDWLLSSKLGSLLDELTIDREGEPVLLVGWLERLVKDVPNLKIFRCFTDAWNGNVHWTITRRSPDAFRFQLQLMGKESTFAEIAKAVETSLDGVPKASLREVRFSHLGALRTKKAREEIDRELRALLEKKFVDVVAE